VRRARPDAGHLAKESAHPILQILALFLLPVRFHCDSICKSLKLWWDVLLATKEMALAVHIVAL
jgi:hypothetical protein